MSNKGDLPLVKGTEVFPVTTKVPVKTVVTGATSSDAAKAFYESISGEIKQFHGKAAQAHALGLPDSSYMQGKVPGGKLRYANVSGLETVHVEVDVVKPAAPEKPEEKKPQGKYDWALIDVVCSPYYQRNLDDDTLATKPIIVEAQVGAGTVVRVDPLGSATYDDGNLHLAGGDLFERIDPGVLPGDQRFSLLVDARDVDPGTDIEIRLFTEHEEFPLPTRRFSGVYIEGVVVGVATDWTPKNIYHYFDDPDDVLRVANLYGLEADDTGTPIPAEFFINHTLPDPMDPDTLEAELLAGLSYFSPPVFDINTTSFDDAVAAIDAWKLTAPRLGSTSTVPYDGWAWHQDGTVSDDWSDGEWVTDPDMDDPPATPFGYMGRFPSEGIQTLPIPGAPEAGLGIIYMTGLPWFYSLVQVGDFADRYSYAVGTFPGAIPPLNDTSPIFVVDDMFDFQLEILSARYVFLPDRVTSSGEVNIAAASFIGDPPFAWSERRPGTVEEAVADGDTDWTFFQWETTDKFPGRLEQEHLGAVSIPAERTEIGTVTFNTSSGHFTFEAA